MSEPLKPPIYKNPYVIAFFAGILTITAIRPLTRHIPDPPPVLAESLPSYEAMDEQGDVFDPSKLVGQVHVCALISASCTSNCLSALDAQRALHVSLTNNVKHASLLTLVIPGTGQSNVLETHLQPAGHPFPWYAAYLSRAAQSADWSFFYGTGSVDRIIHDCREPRLVLIDRHGRLRGAYGIGEWGVDEVFYRATHVLDESLN
jgi:hypothetical protein